MKPVIAKFDGWTRRMARALPSASGPSKSAVRVRLVVPTSISFAPARRMISGIRTPPPISTSSPRDTIDASAPDEPDRQRERGSVVVRDERVFATGQRDQVVLSDACARAATTGLAVEFEEERLLGQPRNGVQRRPRAMTRVPGSYAR